MTGNLVKPSSSKTWSLGAAIGILLGTSSTQAAALNAEIYAERTLMREANARCKLFDPVISQALQLGQVQARNALLRAGGDDSALSRLTRVAEARGEAIACNDQALSKEAGRIRSAFSAYAQISRMSFPGSRSAWKADRTVIATHITGGRWALSGAPLRADGPVQFGVAASKGDLRLFAQPPINARAQPITARLWLRDLQTADRPYLSGAFNLPPRSVSRAYFASNRRIGPDGHEGFEFSESAAKALSDLDPRESVLIEFVYPDAHGDRIVTAVYEVGDFAPAIGFLTLRN